MGLYRNLTLESKMAKFSSGLQLKLAGLPYIALVIHLVILVIMVWEIITGRTTRSITLFLCCEDGELKW